MKKNVTRRIVLGTLIGGLVAGPFVIRSVFRQKREIPEMGTGSLTPYFEGQQNPPMPDISHFEKPFSAVISLEPLLPENRKFSKLVYSGDSQVTMLVTLDKNVVGKPNGQPPKQTAKREMIFDVTPDKKIVINVRSYSEQQPLSKEMEDLMTIRCEVSIDGKTTILSSTEFPHRELSPKYLSSAVTVGSRWTQTLAADKSLYKKGEVETQYEVLNTFEKEGERFMRLETDCTFQEYEPVISASGVPDFGNNTTNLMRVRTISRSDFSIDRGIAEHESMMMFMLTEGVEVGNGKLIIVNGSATLTSCT